jgi:ABC-2 type transport system ATP-binding protein
MASIKLDSVSVFIPVYDAHTRGLKNHVLSAGTGGLIGSDENKHLHIEALRNISHTFNHGDRIGLVGTNGAGKSTMLRLLAGIYEPCQGTVEVEGRISPLFNVALGMDLEETGYENIILRSLCLGMTRAQAEERIEEIEEFTELGDYLSMPLRTYSSGMKMRLAFAISTSVEPEILLLDEGIGAGDRTFIKKTRKRLDKFISQAGIIVVASHSDALIKDMCNKALLLDKGHIINFGDVDDVLEAYRARTSKP